MANAHPILAIQAHQYRDCPIFWSSSHFLVLTGASIDPRRPDEQAEALVRRAFELYQTMAVKKIPQLLLPNAAVPGRVDSVAELDAILSKELPAVA